MAQDQKILHILLMELVAKLHRDVVGWVDHVHIKQHSLHAWQES